MSTVQKTKTLNIAPCSFDASRAAVMRWHYSKSMPSGKLVRYGVWEDNQFVGSVIYGRGATPTVYKRIGMKQTEACELVRVALGEHETPTTKIIAVTLRMLKKSNSGLHLVFSFSDLDQGHQGTIYKAGNWIDVGLRMKGDVGGYVLNGKRVHLRSVCAMMKQHIGHNRNMFEWCKRNKDPNAKPFSGKGKRQWFYPFTANGKKCAQSIVGDAPNDQLGEGGSTPTCTLGEVKDA